MSIILTFIFLASNERTVLEKYIAVKFISVKLAVIFPVQ